MRARQLHFSPRLLWLPQVRECVHRMLLLPVWRCLLLVVVLLRLLIVDHGALVRSLLLLLLQWQLLLLLLLLALPVLGARVIVGRGGRSIFRIVFASRLGARWAAAVLRCQCWHATLLCGAAKLHCRRVKLHWRRHVWV